MAEPLTLDQLRAQVQLQHTYRTNEAKRRGDCKCKFFWEVRQDIPRSEAREILTKCMLAHVEQAIETERKLVGI